MKITLFPRLRSFWFGLTLPYRALKLILSQKSLLILSVIPVLVTLTIYFFAISQLQDIVQTWLLDLLTQRGWMVEGTWRWILELLIKLILIIAGALTFAFTSSIVASPFNDFLAEQTEKFAEPQLPAFTNGSFSAKVRLIWIDLAKTIAATIATLFALLLSWVPLVNILAFACMALLICFQYTSYPQTRRYVALKDGLLFLWRHLFACVGFGAAVTFLFAIPLLSIIALPCAVVGGTLLVARSQKSAEIFDLK